MGFVLDKRVTAAVPIPLDDRIVIETEAVGEQLRNGIYVPGNATDKPVWGRVLAIGPAFQRDEDLRPKFPERHLVKIGDAVLYAKYAGAEIQRDDGSALLLLREDEVLAKITIPEPERDVDPESEAAFNLSQAHKGGLV